MKIIRGLRFLLALVSLRMQKRMAHIPTFLTAFLVDTVVFGVQALVFIVLFGEVESINGWDKWRSVFFVGTFTLIDSLYMATYFFGIMKIPETVQSGKLDSYLTRPADSLLHLAFEQVDPGSFLIAVPAVALLAVCAPNLGVPLGFGSIIAYLAALVLMLVLVFDLMVLVRIPVFWLRRIASFNAAEGALIVFAFRIPGSAYTGFSKILFRVILPYGLIASFPVEVVTGAGIGAWISTLAVVAAFTLLARAAWNLGLRRYEGAGG